MKRTLFAVALGAALATPALAGKVQPPPDSIDRSGPIADDPFASFGGARLGVEVTDLSAELREHFGAPADRGVLVARVAPRSAADEAGLRVADVIVEVGGQPVTDVLALRTAVQRAAGAEAAVEVIRDGQRVRLDAVIEARGLPTPGEGRVERFVFPGGRGEIRTYGDFDAGVASDQIRELIERFDLHGAPPRATPDLHERLDDLEQQLLEMTERLDAATERLEQRLDAIE